MLKPSDITALVEYLGSLDGSTVDYPFTKTLAVYSVSDTPFAYLESGRQIVELSVRLDHQLSKLLRQKYEEVANGRKLDSRQWSTIVLSGQLDLEELKALIYHSYQLSNASSLT